MPLGFSGWYDFFDSRWPWLPGLNALKGQNTVYFSSKESRGKCFWSRLPFLCVLLPFLTNHNCDTARYKSVYKVRHMPLYRGTKWIPCPYCPTPGRTKTVRWSTTNGSLATSRGATARVFSWLMSRFPTSKVSSPVPKCKGFTVMLPCTANKAKVLNPSNRLF